MVKVTVGTGEKQKTFEAYKGVLCFYSGYFESALDGTFSEAHAGHCTLPGEDPATFEQAWFWMCTRQLPPYQPDDPDRLVKLWIFGDAQIVPLLQNAVADRMRDHLANAWELPFSMGQISCLYTKTAKNSPLRRLVIDLVAYTSDGNAFTIGEIAKRWKKKALIDLLKKIWILQGFATDQHNLRQWDMCQYHVHEERAKCAVETYRPVVLVS